jgi:hypothetical protein
MEHERGTKSNGRYILQFFPESLQELRVEIAYHQVLQQRLHDQEDKDIYIQLSEIAAHCGMLLEGTYTRADVLELVDVMIQKLKAMRTPLVLPN